MGLIAKSFKPYSAGRTTLGRQWFIPVYQVADGAGMVAAATPPAIGAAYTFVSAAAQFMRACQGLLLTPGGTLTTGTLPTAILGLDQFGVLRQEVQTQVGGAQAAAFTTYAYSKILAVCHGLLPIINTGTVAAPVYVATIPSTASSGGFITSNITGSVVGSMSVVGTTIFRRTAGSWIADGFAVGNTFTSAGFTTGGNNGSKVVTAVTATDLTVASGLTAEAQGTAVSFIITAFLTTSTTPTMAAGYRASGTGLPLPLLSAGLPTGAIQIVRGNLSTNTPTWTVDNVKNTITIGTDATANTGWFVGLDPAYGDLA